MTDTICIKKLLEENNKPNICRCPRCSEEREKEKEEKNADQTSIDDRVMG